MTSADAKRPKQLNKLYFVGIINDKLHDVVIEKLNSMIMQNALVSLDFLYEIQSV